MGRLIHLVAEREHEFDDVEALVAFARAEFAQLEFGAPWLAEVQGNRVETATRTLWHYLRRDGVVPIATETAIRAEIDETVEHLRAAEGAEPAEVDVRVVLRGRIDRVERDAEGVRIIDFKTGTSHPTGRELPDHGQLRAYQLAFRAGALAEHGAGPDEVELAAAALVHPELPQKPQKRNGYNPCKVSLQPAVPVEELDDLRHDLVGIALGQAGLPVAGATADFDAPPVFHADPESHCTGGRFVHACRIHSIAEVTA